VLLLVLNVSLYSQENLAETQEIQTTEQTDVSENSDKPLSKNDLTILDAQTYTNQNLSSEDINSLQNLNPPSARMELPHKNSFIAVGLSVLVPGMGHVYLGDYATAGSLFGSSAIGAGALFNRNTSIPGYYVLECAESYGIYAAYRDARLYNNNVGYSYKMPMDSFKDLSLAPFNYKVLKKPEVWGGLLGSLAAAVGVVYLENTLDIFPRCKITKSDARPLGAFPTGFSEEVLFRGFLQSALSETCTPAGGLILSSLLFGAAHIPNAKYFSPEERKRYYAFSIPFITSLGAYFGWMTYKNQSLQESVALHSWYDFTLFALERAAVHSAVIGKPNIAISFSF
jgi:hypothetical protein